MSVEINISPIQTGGAIVTQRLSVSGAIQTGAGSVSGDIAMGNGGGTCPVYEVWTGGSY